MVEQTVPEVLQQAWDAARGKKLETLAALLRDSGGEGFAKSHSKTRKGKD